MTPLPTPLRQRQPQMPPPMLPRLPIPWTARLTWLSEYQPAYLTMLYRKGLLHQHLQERAKAYQDLMRRLQATGRHEDEAMELAMETTLAPQMPEDLPEPKPINPDLFNEILLSLIPPLEA